MKCYFRSFDVGTGDCCVIRLVIDDERQYVIMVDCGKYTSSLKKYVENVLHNHINLLIATHIDGDHIQGLATLLKKHPDMQIDHIWYNSYRRTTQTANVELSEHQKAILQQIQKTLPVEFDAINYREVSAPQGITLAKAILENEAWKAVWNMEYITDQTPDFDLPEGLGKIVILGPTLDAMEAIETKFKDSFNKFFMQQWNESLKNGEELQELLIRLADAYKTKFPGKFVSSTEELAHDAAFIREKAKDENEDDSDTNYSSIAFILECGGQRVTMLGDSFAKSMVKSIDSKYGNEPKPLSCAAIKVAHHGSNGNTSNDLLDRINSHRYFIAGGRGEDYPTWEVFGRLAISHHDEHPKQIVFSHKGDMSSQMCSISDNTKQELGIETIITEQEYELFEW